MIPQPDPSLWWIFPLLQMLVTSGAAVALFKGGIAMRDAVHELKDFTLQLRKEVDDHENRLRSIEGRALHERRSHERREPLPSTR